MLLQKKSNHVITLKKETFKFTFKFKCHKHRQNNSFQSEKFERQIFWSNPIKVFYVNLLQERLCLIRITIRYVDAAKQRLPVKFTPTGFFTNIVNLKLTDYGPVHKISHIVDVDNFFRMDNSDKHV